MATKESDLSKSTTLNDWVDSYTHDLYSWAVHKIGRKDIAEDLVQEVFLAAFNSMSTFEGKSSVKTWLHSILNRKIADHYRAHYKNVSPTSDASSAFMSSMFNSDGHWSSTGLPQAWNEDVHLLDNPDFQSILTNCMSKLPANWKAVMQYKFLEDKKSEDVCQELEITATNLWQIMHRSKLQLRKCLEMHWFAA